MCSHLSPADPSHFLCGNRLPLAPAEGMQPFAYRLTNGSAAPRVCYGNGTCAYPGATDCDPAADSSAFLPLYWAGCILILKWGVSIMMKRRQKYAPPTPADSGSPPRSSDQPPTATGRLLALYKGAQSTEMVMTWIGLAILVQNLGQSWLQDIQQHTLSLAESNAVSDVSSITTVIKDVCSFFEDGMTVLIGAAVGRGDTAGAGYLVGLGYVAGAASGVVGGLVGTALAMAPGVMAAIVPPSAAVGCGGGGEHHDPQAELEALARPYWLLSVWTWCFAFCNNVGTGVVLGAMSTLGYFVAVVVSQAAAIGGFLLLTRVAGASWVSHNAAVGWSAMLSEGLYFLCISYTVFRNERVRAAVAFPKWSVLLNTADPAVRHWAWVAASSGSAMMLQMLSAQLRSTIQTQLLARLGAGGGGLQYRFSIFGEQPTFDPVLLQFNPETV